MLNIKNLPQKSGIYKVTNQKNGHSYIGQAYNIQERFTSHHIYDYKNERSKEYNKQFYQALRKYGIENFIVEVIELCSKEKLDEREIYWISYYDTYHNGYNADPGGQMWSDSIHSKEVEAKRQATRERNKSLQGENHPRAKLSNEEVINIRLRYKNGESIEQIYKDYKELYSSKETLKSIIFSDSYSKVDNPISLEDIRYTNAKFTKEQIIEIRSKYYIENFTYSQLAKEYGVTVHAIIGICERTSYAHIQDNIPNLRKRASYRLSEQEVKEIRKKYKEGYSCSCLAKEYKVGVSAISRCCQRITYTNID